MAIASLISRTRVSTLPETPLNGRVVLQPNTWYTCPTGKKAIVKGRVTCTGLGAASEARFSVAGVIMHRWEALSNIISGSFSVDGQYNDNQANFKNAAPNVYINFDVTLDAGETIITSQNSGTNAEFNLFSSVLELPA